MQKTQSQLAPRKILTDLYDIALNAVNGQLLVERYLQKLDLKGNVAIISVGKAASAMMLGAKNQLKNQIESALLITKAGCEDHSLGWPCIEAGHPVPDKNSLAAGHELLDFISHIPKETKILALISGGASALVDVLPDDFDLEHLQKLNMWLLASGLTIYEMNRIRQAVSLIKGGKVLKYLLHTEMTQLLISDVKNDDIEIIGSGLFVESNSELSLADIPAWLHKYIQATTTETKVSVESHIIANNEMACQAILEHARQANNMVTYHGQTLYGEVFELAQSLVKKLVDAKPGLHIWGGETTLVLPSIVGQGGRNQSLALAMACALEGVDNITVLVGATDGSDGPTDDAGAIIDGTTVQRGQNIGKASDYLKAADAGTFLAEAGDLISTGATATNVMDIVIALKSPIATAPESIT